MHNNNNNEQQQADVCVIEKILRTTDTQLAAYKSRVAFVSVPNTQLLMLFVLPHLHSSASQSLSRARFEWHLLQHSCILPHSKAVAPPQISLLSMLVSALLFTCFLVAHFVVVYYKRCCLPPPSTISMHYILCTQSLQTTSSLLLQNFLTPLQCVVGVRYCC